MKIILRDRNQELVDAWKVHFRDTDVEIGCGDIFDVPADAIVSPSNSAGFLNGGIDAVYTQRFGPGLQKSLQEYLASNHDGELCVGEAVSICIDGDPVYKVLISAPTMRVPTNVSGSVNAYLAFRAVLRLLKTERSVKSVLCPGLATAVGKMDYNTAASQMREAYRIVWQNQPLIFETVGDAYRYHEELRRGLI